METTPLVTLLAFGSIVLALIALALFIYVMRRQRRQRPADAAEPTMERASTTATSPPPAAEPPSTASAKRTSKVTQHSLFVIFSHPDEQTDQRLAAWLREKNATFDPIKKVFHIAGEQPSNPVTIANAFPPGEMPDLLRDETHDPIKGISLLVKPPLRKRRNQQMHVYVALAKEMQTLFTGDMLDADREPATDITFERIIG
ncbi:MULTISPECIES: cell division protein ZipA C-terminal FtsZ-binding domain-containing protein [unclassified Halomonas]|uniref:cell division protein ZipA C-terminal FtsZ-binding domain-containing protein n=1 Tax=unclassified Halomonas TaxID=2609666 RepID=UPI0006DAE08F|nr:MULTISPECIES: cell division protein ZipA C-terminal FtsZ-binding domain-containing protein [unclassified Halomonas]KPQ21538.1 MAG: ZipA, C-terminal FtsZ-binding domain [Halomonas sp. HL-93]SBR45644.1 ZipA, C-terminal FtsZ-binding domain [Halomonas sp. HL-93]SNY98382.1 ZipA, C-terminal FtsZ-binding domain [Halomonas sp. hl-4]